MNVFIMFAKLQNGMVVNKDKMLLIHLKNILKVQINGNVSKKNLESFFFLISKLVCCGK